MEVTLTPHGRELLEAALAQGLGNSPEEVLERALESVLAPGAGRSRRNQTPAEAVRHIREARRGVFLGGISIRELIDEGRKR